MRDKFIQICNLKNKKISIKIMILISNLNHSVVSVFNISLLSLTLGQTINQESYLVIIDCDYDELLIQWLRKKK